MKFKNRRTLLLDQLESRDLMATSGGLFAAMSPAVQADLAKIHADMQAMQVEMHTLAPTLAKDQFAVQASIQVAYKNDSAVTMAVNALGTDAKSWQATLQTDAKAVATATTTTARAAAKAQLQTDFTAATKALQSDQSSVDVALKADAGVAAATAQLQADAAPLTADQATLQADYAQLQIDLAGPTTTTPPTTTPPTSTTTTGARPILA